MSIENDKKYNGKMAKLADMAAMIDALSSYLGIIERCEPDEVHTENSPPSIQITIRTSYSNAESSTGELQLGNTNFEDIKGFNELTVSHLKALRSMAEYELSNLYESVSNVDRNLAPRVNNPEGTVITGP